ncbi:S-locus glycoprotein domain-containing protein [Artemisia annua]|uniref:non-specific serine/threonine protein kinase n=1 Tax=Artemisia annua TaxID=35608 RepID=A0A2U1MVH2_ARTAN|nr:S-locus glycoprotein domain-containing protein [Artemisia annua]
MSTTHPLLLITTIIIFLVLASKTSYAQTRNQTISSSIATFPWTPSQNKTLTSNNSIFSSGFIPAPNSPNEFIFSVYYKNISPITTIWSLDTLVNASSGLTIAVSGELRIAEATLPGSPRASNSTNNTSFRLNNDGSLSVGSWSSFQHPTDTYVPNQNITGHVLTVKRGPGSTFRFDGKSLLFSGGYDNETEYYSIGGNKFQSLDGQGKVQLENGATFITSDYGDVTLRRIKLDTNGNLRVYSWDSGSGMWNVVWQAVPELCRIKGTCGPNFVCMYGDTYDTTVCDCPPGFSQRTGSNGEEECKRKVEFGNDSKFLELDYVNFTGGSGQGDEWSIEAWNFTMCESACANDIECLGFGYKYDGQRYCTLVKQLYYGIWSPATEAAFFLRVAKSETDQTNFTGLTSILETTCPVQISLPFPPEESKSTTRNIAIISTLFAAELISGVAFFWAFLKKYVKYRDMARTFGLEFLPAGGPKRFSYAELKTATNDFSSTNVVGKGGFGDVYKGVLTDHRIVAVKCLKNVTGGDNEFWAEVTIIARMHHLNLVRLWGFCAEKGQRILVYEYVPNGSLDKFLFQKFDYTNGNEDDAVEGSKLLDRKPILDWGIRYRIALGVARAIAYLHEECLEWVLHCDIKPENILLGADFCPKISDFGLSKLRKKEDMVSYSRMRGTRGYMAPEWVKSDQITPKADVYSFGMVLLEIVTGVRNFDIQGSKMDSEDWYFPRWAFDKVYKEMNIEDILDKHIKQSYDSRLHEEMITRMVKTAIWCLQDRPEMRPSMGKVAKMLEGTVEIIEPKKPTIFFLGDE